MSATNYVVKVTVPNGDAYYVHFDRETGVLVEVHEHKKVYDRDGKRELLNRLKAIVDTAETKFQKTNGVKQ